MSKSAKKPDKEKLKRVQEAIRFAQGLLEKKGDGAEAVLVTYHVVKDGRIHHHFHYQDFPTSDWGPCMVAIGVEARNAFLMAQSGNARVS